MRHRYTFPSTEWFAESMAPFRALDSRASIAQVFDFLQETPSPVVDKFAVLVMPMEFSTYFLHKRLVTSSKEAFRRAFIYGIGNGLDRRITTLVHANGELSPTELGVVNFIRDHGSFEMSQLVEILGHAPTKQEREEVQTFLSTMTDTNWERLLRNNGKSR